LGGSTTVATLVVLAVGSDAADVVVIEVFGFGVSTGAGVAGVVAFIGVLGAFGVVAAPAKEKPPFSVDVAGGALFSVEVEAAPPKENPPAAGASAVVAIVGSFLVLFLPKEKLPPAAGAVEACSLVPLPGAAPKENPPVADEDDFGSFADDAAGAFPSVPDTVEAPPNENPPLAGVVLFSAGAEVVAPAKEKPPFFPAESIVDAAGAAVAGPNPGVDPYASFLSPWLCTVDPPKENAAGALVSVELVEGAGAGVAPKAGGAALAETPEVAGVVVVLL